jgi:hypothetical protein
MRKTGHCDFQNQPLGPETGQYRQYRKEHIANEEQIMYSAPIAIRQEPTALGGAALPYPSNPGHKEHGT